ncbi:hypothetical protein ACIHQR_21695 [Corallococcus coralloides]|uniref:hypothetical protein n=1 Tax=Corallococcus coralloides TaxID=184914 RepID=UPI00384E50A4
MRQIEVGDIHRALLQSLVMADGEGQRHSSHLDMREGMRLCVTAPAQDLVLQELLGRLSYRNRELIGRLFGRLQEFLPEEKDPVVDMLGLWESLGKELLERRHTFFVRAERFEQWRRYFQGLDEDLPALAMLANEDRGKDISAERALLHVYPWHTFATGDDRQLVQELRKGVACQHLHLSGSYPAPYFWVGLMNRRFPIEGILENMNEPERRHRYFSIVPPHILRQQVQLAAAIRYILFDYLRKSLHPTSDADPREATGKLLLSLLEKRQAPVKSLDARSLLEPGPQNSWDIDLTECPGSDRDKTDYAQLISERSPVDWVGAECPSLLGERMLLYLLLQHVARGRSEQQQRKERGQLPDTKAQDFDRSLAQALWVYLQAKNIFLGTIQQREGFSGFDYFEHTLRMVRTGADSSNFVKERDRWAWEVGRFLQESHSVIKIEFRVAPPDLNRGPPDLNRGIRSYDNLLKTISTIQKTMTENLSGELLREHQFTQVGLIVHFIKSRGDPLSARLSRKGKAAYRIFHYSLRDEIRQQKEVLLNYLKSTNYESLRMPGPASFPVEICGIDTANRELYCPPEIFGSIYGQFARQELGRTFHVGEDFIHITTGLRRIYEAISFLKLSAGDRLGHCIALGMNPRLWVHSNPVVSIHRMDLLDDAVFEWALLQKYAASDLLRLGELERRIAHYSIAIYGKPIDPYILQEAWGRRAQDFHDRKDVLDRDDIDKKEQIPRWVAMQGLVMKEVEQQRRSKDDPACGGAHNIIPSVSDLGEVMKAYRLKEKFKPEDWPGEVRPEDWPGEVRPEDWPKDLAARLLDEYLYDKHTIDRGLVLEMIPTLPELGNILRLQEILRTVIMSSGLTVESNPSSNWLIGGFERLYDVPAVRWALHHQGFPMTVNPDDPVTFSTSIENEYFFVLSCLMKGTAEAPPLSRLEALERIRLIREQGLESSFLQKPTGRRLLPSLGGALIESG